ncbi:hypothetical protein J6590_046103 [Homalodisca vitripennis]|nr:hypothetical protein J6590_046103 [Homalodisca vitripennis]
MACSSSPSFLESDAVTDLTTGIWSHYTNRAISGADIVGQIVHSQSGLRDIAARRGGPRPVLIDRQLHAQSTYCSHTLVCQSPRHFASVGPACDCYRTY